MADLNFLSRRYYIADGARDFTVPPYLEKDDISVYVNGVKTTAWSWFTDTVIRLDNEPTPGSEVVIVRNTDDDAPKVYFQPGPINTTDMNAQVKQDFYLIQEGLDIIRSAGYLDPSELYDVAAKVKLDADRAEGAYNSYDTQFILNKLNGAITAGQLTPELAQPISDVPGLQSKMELLNSQWTLKLQDGGFIAGVGLLLYPDWQAETAYVPGDYVWHNGQVYQCIAAHTGQEPPDTNYWALVPYGTKSEFIIRSDKFAVVQPNGEGGAKAPFVVGSVNGVSTVGIDGNMLVDGTITATKLQANQVLVGHTIQSSNYSSNTAGWKIAQDGSAEFNEGTFRGTLAVGSSGYNNLSDKPASLADINPQEKADLDASSANNLVTDPLISRTGSSVDDRFWNMDGENIKVGSGAPFGELVPVIQVYPNGVQRILTVNSNSEVRWFPCSHGEKYYFRYYYFAQTGTTNTISLQIVSAKADKSQAVINAQAAFTPTRGAWALSEGSIVIDDADAKWGYIRIVVGADTAGLFLAFDNVFVSTHKPGADITAENTALNTANVGAVPASNVAGWAMPTDTTKINGGSIHVGSRIAIGGTGVYGADGIQLEYNDGDPRFYAGDGANQYVKFDGSTLSVRGSITVEPGSPGSELLLNSYNKEGGNMLQWSNFEGQTSQSDGKVGGWEFVTGESTFVGVGINYSPDWSVKGCNVAYLQSGSRIGGDDWDYYSHIHSRPVPVIAGQKYGLSVFTGGLNCKIRAFIFFFDSDNTLIGAPGSENTQATGGSTLADFYLHNICAVAPAGAVTARVFLIKSQTNAGQSSSYLFACLPMFASVGADQTVAPSWARGSNDTVTASNLDTTIISGGKIVTGLLTADNIQTGTMSAARIAAGTIYASHIVTGTLTYTQLADNAVGFCLMASAAGTNCPQIGPFTRVGGSGEAFLATAVACGQIGTGTPDSGCNPATASLSLLYYVNSWTRFGYIMYKTGCETYSTLANTYLLKPGGTGSIYFRADHGGFSIYGSINSQIAVVQLRR